MESINTFADLSSCDIIELYIRCSDTYITHCKVSKDIFRQLKPLRSLHLCCLQFLVTVTGPEANLTLQAKKRERERDTAIC